MRRVEERRAREEADPGAVSGVAAVAAESTFADAYAGDGAEDGEWDGGVPSPEDDAAAVAALGGDEVDGDGSDSEGGVAVAPGSGSADGDGDGAAGDSGSDSDAGKWACVSCTFKNTPAERRCAVCGEVRGGSISPALSKYRNFLAEGDARLEGGDLPHAIENYLHACAAAKEVDSPGLEAMAWRSLRDAYNQAGDLDKEQEAAANEFDCRRLDARRQALERGPAGGGYAADSDSGEDKEEDLGGGARADAGGAGASGAGGGGGSARGRPYGRGSSRGGSGTPTRGGMSWVCEHCTYENIVGSRRCIMCSELRVPDGEGGRTSGQEVTGAREPRTPEGARSPSKATVARQQRLVAAYGEAREADDGPGMERAAVGLVEIAEAIDNHEMAAIWWSRLVVYYDSVGKRKELTVARKREEAARQRLAEAEAAARSSTGRSVGRGGPDPPSGGESDDDGPKWTCSRCTLENDARLSFCTVCGGANPDAPAEFAAEAETHARARDLAEQAVQRGALLERCIALWRERKSAELIPEAIKLINLARAGNDAELESQLWHMLARSYRSIGDDERAAEAAANADLAEIWFKTGEGVQPPLPTLVGEASAARDAESAIAAADATAATARAVVSDAASRRLAFDEEEGDLEGGGVDGSKPATGSDAEKSKVWSCEHCTFDNPADEDFCQACGAPPADETNSAFARLNVLRTELFAAADNMSHKHIAAAATQLLPLARETLDTTSEGMAWVHLARMFNNLEDRDLAVRFAEFSVDAELGQEPSLEHVESLEDVVYKLLERRAAGDTPLEKIEVPWTCASCTAENTEKRRRLCSVCSAPHPSRAAVRDKLTELQRAAAAIDEEDAARAEPLREMAGLAREAREPLFETQAWTLLRNFYFRIGRFKDSSAAARTVVACYRLGGDYRDIQVAWHALAMALHESDGAALAARAYGVAASVAQLVKEPRRAADALLARAKCEMELRQPEEAVRTLHGASTLTDDADTLYDIWQAMGRTRIALGDDAGALECFNRVLRLARDSEDALREATALLEVGMQHNRIGQYAHSVDALWLSVARYQAIRRYFLRESDDPTSEVPEEVLEGQSKALKMLASVHMTLSLQASSDGNSRAHVFHLCEALAVHDDERERATLDEMQLECAPCRSLSYGGGPASKDGEVSRERWGPLTELLARIPAEAAANHVVVHYGSVFNESSPAYGFAMDIASKQCAQFRIASGRPGEDGVDDELASLCGTGGITRLHIGARGAEPPTDEHLRRWLALRRRYVAPALQAIADVLTPDEDATEGDATAGAADRHIVVVPHGLLHGLPWAALAALPDEAAEEPARSAVARVAGVRVASSLAQAAETLLQNSFPRPPGRQVVFACGAPKALESATEEAMMASCALASPPDAAGGGAAAEGTDGAEGADGAAEAGDSAPARVIVGEEATADALLDLLVVPVKEAAAGKLVSVVHVVAPATQSPQLLYCPVPGGAESDVNVVYAPSIGDAFARGTIAKLPRLVVLSCRPATAEPERSMTSESVLLLARSAVMAGASSVWSVLWNRNDAATTMLLCKAYSELFDGEAPSASAVEAALAVPGAAAAALWRAQNWLRAAPLAECQEWVENAVDKADMLMAKAGAEHCDFFRLPAALSEAAAAAGVVPGDAEGKSTAVFASPAYWGGVVAVG